MLVDDTAGTTQAGVLADLVNNDSASLRFSNSAAGATAWVVGGANASDFAIRPGGQSQPSLTLAPDGRMPGGHRSRPAADPAAAVSRTPADGAAILAALRGLDLATWAYAADPQARRHLWPTAPRSGSAPTRAVSPRRFARIEKRNRRMSGRVAALERQVRRLAAQLR